MPMQTGTPRGWTRRRNHKADFSINDTSRDRDFRGHWSGTYTCRVCGEQLDRNGTSHFPQSPESISPEFKWEPKS